MNLSCRLLKFTLAGLLLMVAFLTHWQPAFADVGDVDTERTSITKTEVTDIEGEPVDGSKEKPNWFNRLKEIAKGAIKDLKEGWDWTTEQFKEFKDWFDENWDKVKNWEIWDHVQEFFNNKIVKVILTALGVIAVIAALIFGGVYVLGLLGITVGIGAILTALGGAIVGVVISIIGGETGFGGMLAGGLSGALSVFGGFAVLRLLKGSKLLSLVGLPRLFAFAAGTGAGAVAYSFLHGTLHYLFTGDSSLLREAFTWESILSNFTMGAVLGPLGAKLLKSVGPANLMKGPGNWIAGFTAKLLKKPFSRKLASQINKGVHIVKNSAIYSGATSLMTSAFDAFSQWRQTGKVDWKKNGKRAAIVAALTIPLIGAGMFAGTKAKIFGDDAPVVSRTIQQDDVHFS
ncbi:hypothetical protein B9K06_23840, partial [Bacillus sp. OG2]